MHPPPHTSAPDIDVLITVYNGDRFISRTIQSVIDQTFSNWRLIVVDDRSTDDTARIVAAYAARDSRISLIEGRHLGIAAAANVGLARVMADYVARLDADDIAAPGRLATQFAFLQSHPGVVAVGSDVRLIDENDKPLRRRRMPESPKTIRETLKTRNCIIHPSTMLRTQVLRKIGGYREKFSNSEDYDLWLRMSAVGDIVNLPQCLTSYRRHPSQITAPDNKRRLTIYSVAAATDHFLRRYAPPGLQCAIDEAKPDDLAEKLAMLYGFQPAPDDLRAINRHAIRLLRYVDRIDEVARTRLTEIATRNLNFMERMKLHFYNLERKEH